MGCCWCGCYSGGDAWFIRSAQRCIFSLLGIDILCRHRGFLGCLGTRGSVGAHNRHCRSAAFLRPSGSCCREWAGFGQKFFENSVKLFLNKIIQFGRGYTHFYSPTIWFIFSINGLHEWLIQYCIELTSLTNEQIHIIYFVLLGVFKIQILLIFLLPYFCIKLFLRKSTR